MRAGLARSGQPEPPVTPNFYDLLQLAPDASTDDIAAAYQRQREIYDPAHAEVMGQEFVAVAHERRALLDQALGVLQDPQRRQVYDRELGLVVDETTGRRGVSGRELIYAIGGILAGLLVLAGLWYTQGRGTRAGPAVVEVDYAAPAFALRTLDGGRFDLAEQRGKVVLVNFWATWCEPCKQEIPALQSAYQKLKDQGLVIVGVDLFDGELKNKQTEQQIRQFTDSYGVQYPIALDETGQVARDYRLWPIPVSYFIDPDGNVRYIRIGELRAADVEQLFDDLWQQHQARSSSRSGAGVSASVADPR